MPDFSADAEKSASTKNALRSRLITSRKSLSEADLVAAASSVQRVLLDLLTSPVPRSATTLGPPPHSTIAAYVPIGSEPGGVDLPQALAAALADTRLLLPVLRPDSDLDWAAFTGEFQRGRRGLSEPVGPLLGVDAVAAATVVVVPALAVDRTGMRLGRGGGSYDRVLTRLQTRTRAFTIALLHDGELVDVVPADAHDRAVDAVVTPSGGFALRPQPEWTK